MDGGDEPSDSMLVEHYLECSQADDSYPKDQPMSVQGRLRERSSFWRDELEASEFVLDIVTNGYKLPFIAFPQPMIAKNHRSAFKHARFVEESIDDLVHSRCVRECTSCPTVCSPLLVVENAKGKLRLVIDLRYVNQFLIQCKFKYEGLDLVPSLFRKGDFVFSFNLKSGYHHVDIHEESQPYLGFSWGEGDKKKFYLFCASFRFIHSLLRIYQTPKAIG